MDLNKLKIYRSKILAIATKYGAHHVRVFGSISRDQGTPSSDLDLLIELEQGRTLLDIVAIKQDLEELLGCPVDVVTKDAISPYMRDAILKSAVNL
ncbi:MAG: nucleotidyltransferase [Deltaproteobacteria bacterium GWA2_38_16]|nr:MAG: nucleotidyltransferase [Deltaproteobacteria bacterium GWA2_38_16]OGQ03555.1 MAG: nucleotidyltransferase [Deltaproteobacteria bacterium RIFCSPHIGHO2_02_FULL_38_15]OGQ33263.1 MAG: nucleotidyltransferase [Deltaproteobacteria bacterium RIFCSPLOWO2_01_FULL_38_9]OGQ61430.1 MAG: nucleotidyltransferase [Deltaproteobacteria bacterium RIFCSPLOWO2_12_FULL_38_8]HBQ21203.1 nucleotidyltransferase [Deltaproteobacteria bacterium]